MLAARCFGGELASGEPDGWRISHARWPPRCSLRSTRRLCVRAMHTRIPTSRAESETAAASSPSTRAHLGCQGTWYVPNARGWYVYPVRTVRGPWGQAALRLRYVPNAGGWYA